jgi:metal-dependent amidase/aminoacylase/carboxypeptidase family protein
VFTGNPVTGAEDFSFFGERVPSFFFRLGGRPADVAVEDAPAHHTPYFFVDEAALPVGVRAMTALALDYLER